VASWVARFLVGPLLIGLAAALVTLVPSTFSVTAAGPFTTPHAGYNNTTDSCAACHRSHTGRNAELLASPAPQSTFCFTCHDGTGATYNVAAEFSDPNVPANNASTSSYYSHPATVVSNHTTAQATEFAGVLNRHSECSDCHNPHSATSAAPAQTGAGWTNSGSLAEITGVNKNVPPSWKNPIGYEYELCFKCHSSYTLFAAQDKESYKKFDKAAELATTNASYHPIEGAGKNTTPQMAASLAGGKLWQFTTTSTVRCTNCHGNYRLVGNPPAANVPQNSARLAPHASQNRGILIANYQDRQLKAQGVAYNSNDFALCFLCHKEAPFTTTSTDARTDTNFRYHGLHVSDIPDKGSTAKGMDIDVAGAGQGNALCAECHYRIHSTQAAYLSSNRTYQRLVNFAPNVEPASGSGPAWSFTAGNPDTGSCTLLCHGQEHVAKPY